MKKYLQKLHVVNYVRYCWIFLFVLGLWPNAGRSQMNYWVLPPNVVNFTGGSPSASSIPGATSTQYVAANGAYDNNGNLLFYVKAEQTDMKLFSSTGSLVGSLNALPYTCNVPNSTSDRPNREITIIPRFGYCNQHYVIWSAANVNLAGTSLGYAIINTSGATSIVQQSTMIKCTGDNYGSLAVSKLISGTRYLLFLSQGSLFRFTITGGGFTNETLIANSGTIPTLNAVSDELEISPDQNSISWVKTQTGDVYVASVNLATPSISNVRTYTSAAVAQGIEFDNTSSRIFSSCSIGLYYRDISLGSGAMTSIASSSSYNKTQLEMGKNNLIYAVNSSGSLGAITTSGTPSVAGAGLGITLYSNSGHAITYPINDPSYTLPDQIDGENYNWFFTTPSVTITQNGILCAGSTTTLTANPAPSGIPVTYNWSTGATTQVATISVGGTHTVTVTDQNGCSASANISVTQQPKPIIAALTSEETNRCTQQGNILLSAVPGAGNQATFQSYLWASSPITSVNGAITQSVNAPPHTQSTIYTVTVTSNFNCTASQTVTINWLQNCCNGTTVTKPVSCGGGTVNLTYYNVNLSKIYQDICGTGNVLDLNTIAGTDKKIAINGNLTVDGTYTIKNCTYTSTVFNNSGGIRFASNSSLIIPTGSSLTIDNCYLLACSNNMWNGIRVAINATLITQNNTVIADALAGVSGLVTGGLFGLGTVTLQPTTKFYRNRVGFDISFGAATRHRVNGCEFKYDAANALMNFMLAPDNGKRPSVGVGVYNSSGSYWQIPDVIFGTANTFDGINCGIYASESNVRVNANTFNNIRNYNNVTYGGRAIHCNSAFLSLYGNSVWVQTNSDLGASAFNNCDYGVYVNFANAVVQNNKMASIKNGIYASNCPFHNLDFNYNNIGLNGSPADFGITFNNVLGAAGIPKAVSNTIYLNEPYMDPNTFLFVIPAGIVHTESSNAVVNCNGGTRDCRPLIELNNIYNGVYGVYVNNAYGTRITNNNINLTNAVVTSQTKACIYLSGANMPLVTVNTLTGNGNVYDENPLVFSSHQRRTGIRLSNSTAEICNNTMNSIGYGAEFIAGCNGTQFKRNILGASRYGVVLKNNGATGGIIGQQGAANLTHGNNFTGPFNNTPSAFRTYCFNSDGSQSPFRVISPIASQQPEPNGATSGYNPIIKLQSSTSTAWSCSVQWKSLRINQGDLYSKDIAEGKADEYMELGFEESGSWLTERDLFNRLDEDHSLLQSKDLYQEFYAAKSEQSIGQIKAYDMAVYQLTNPALVKDSLSFEAHWEEAVSKNNAIAASIQPEQNRKTVNDIYLHTVARGITSFSAEQEEILFRLASQCPYSDGDAVYMARSLYNIVNHSALFDDDKICNATATYKMEQAKKSTQSELSIRVSPNPASDKVDIVIKGSKEDLRMMVYNNLGEIVGNAVVNHYVEFDVSNFTNGVYQVCFISPNGTVSSSRLVVAK
ncbi:MAG: T9SS type A sorting domain-containing protein [Bacteroidetes bacterium]|nr:T9SS type A sorting domain-containing protein [Bacteroidota bacterium]